MVIATFSMVLSLLYSSLRPYSRHTEGMCTNRPNFTFILFYFFEKEKKYYFQSPIVYLSPNLIYNTSRLICLILLYTHASQIIY